MRTSVGLAALLLGLALAAPAAAQDASDYWPSYSNNYRNNRYRRKPPPPPGLFDHVKTFAAAVFDYNTYLPYPGTTQNSVEDPRLLPSTTPSKFLVDIIDVARPQDMPKVFIP